MNNIRLRNSIWHSDITNTLYDVEATIKNTSELFNSLIVSTLSKKDTQNADELLSIIVNNINKINNELEIAISISISI